MTSQELSLVIKASLTVWLVGVAAWDLLTRRIPNALVLPMMAGAMGWQIFAACTHRPHDILFAVASWVMILVMWRGRVFGGGDAKLLMSLFALFPTRQFLLLLGVVVLAVAVPLLMSRALRRLRARSATEAIPSTEDKGILPAASQAVTRGENYSWVFAVPGVIYLWLVF